MIIVVTHSFSQIGGAGFLATFQPRTAQADSAFAFSAREAVAVVAQRNLRSGQQAMIHINGKPEYTITAR